jgi:hypothetical protein
MGNVRTWNHGSNGVWDSVNSWDPVQFVSYPGADDNAVITIAGESGPYWVEVQNVTVSVGGQIV